MKYLKSYQHYADLYDRHTVEQCRRTEQRGNKATEDLPPLEGKKFNKKEAARVRQAAVAYILHFETGERYLNREKRIQEWMDADQKRDKLLESAQAPEDIRCLMCRSKLASTFKELWSELDKEDRVLFMYDCPNKCLPRRAFFSDGQEWRTKPNLCPRCDTELKRSMDDTGEKLVTTDTCSKCKYTKSDELVWTHKKEEAVDMNFAKDRDRFCLTSEDGRKYQDEKWRLEQMGKFMEEWKEKEKVREEKLKANPKGFHLEGASYTCFICGDHTPEGDNWYDEYGIKCLICQKAIDEGEIPASLARDKDSWYSKWDLERYFNLKSPALRKWVKDGIIQVRTVSNFGKGVHTELFLLEDNMGFLPPKKMLESHSVEEKKDGKTWYHSEPWYRFVDPFKHLKGYRIMEHMRVVPPEEVAAREEEQKRKWEEKRALRELKKSKKKKNVSKRKK